MGDAVTLLVPVELAPVAAELAEALHTSDLPGGVVNLVTGDVEEMVGHVLAMDDLDAVLVYEGAVDAALKTSIDAGSAKVLRRIVPAPRAARPASPMLLQRLAEVQTVWMSSGTSVRGSGGAY
jgi:aldehyde dehydrogenase (NAD+)